MACALAAALERGQLHMPQCRRPLQLSPSSMLSTFFMHMQSPAFQSLMTP
jgi:hypothetical protein